MITESFKAYSHRVLLVLTYVFLAILLFGILGQSFLTTVLEFLDLIFGASIFMLLRKVIATYDTEELFKLCFSLAFIDWLLYKGHNQFRINIESKFQNAPKFKNYLWK